MKSQHTEILTKGKKVRKEREREGQRERERERVDDRLSIKENYNPSVTVSANLFICGNVSSETENQKVHLQSLSFPFSLFYLSREWTRF